MQEHNDAKAQEVIVTRIEEDYFTPLLSFGKAMEIWPELTTLLQEEVVTKKRHFKARGSTK